jgi:hypothetical protein
LKQRSFLSGAVKAAGKPHVCSTLALALLFRLFSLFDIFFETIQQ